MVRVKYVTTIAGGSVGSPDVEEATRDVEEFDFPYVFPGGLWGYPQDGEKSGPNLIEDYSGIEYRRLSETVLSYSDFYEFETIAIYLFDIDVSGTDESATRDDWEWPGPNAEDSPLLSKNRGK